MGERQQLPESVAHLESMGALRALRGSHERLGATHIATDRAHSNHRVEGALRCSYPPDLTTGQRLLLDTVTGGDG
jgi:hypothetical protein